MVPLIKRDVLPPPFPQERTDSQRALVIGQGYLARLEVWALQVARRPHGPTAPNPAPPPPSTALHAPGRLGAGVTLLSAPRPQHTLLY